MLCILLLGACNLGVPANTPTPPPPINFRSTPTSQNPTQAEPPAFIVSESPIAPALPTRIPTFLPTPTARADARNTPTFTATQLAFSNTTIANRADTTSPTIPPTVALRVTLAPRLPRDWQLTPIVLNPENSFTRPYSIDGSGHLTGGRLANLPGAPTLVRENPNPAHEVQFAARNSLGSLYFIQRDGQSERLSISPASRYEAQSAETNRAFVGDLRWSVNGEHLAILIHSDLSAEDGIWWMRPGISAPERLLVDCPRSEHPGCQIIDRSDGPYTWRTFSMDWSPDGETLLARVKIYEPRAHSALMLLKPGRDYNRLPLILDYEYGSWLADGRLLVSGQGVSEPANLAIYSAQGLWLSEIRTNNTISLHFAAEATDGQIYALGRAEGKLSLYQLADGQAKAVGSPLILPWPEFAHWDWERSALDITVEGQVYSLYTQATGNWANPIDELGLPSGVVLGADYSPGEQLRVSSAALNLRNAPSLDGEIITLLRQSEFVLVLAGPYESGAEVWWKVQDAVGHIGWVAGESEGQKLLERDAAG